MSTVRAGIRQASTALLVLALGAACAGGVHGASVDPAAKPAAASATEAPASVGTVEDPAPDTSPAPTVGSPPPTSASGADGRADSAAASTDVDTSGATTDATTGTSPSTSSSTSSSSTSSTAPTTSTTVPPTMARRFAESLAGLTVLYHATPVPSGVRDSVARLSLLVGRPPDPDAVVLGTQLLVSEVRTLEQLAEERLASEEYVRRNPDASAGAFVAALYRDVLGRAGSAEEVELWTAELAAGAERADVATRFTESDEAVRRTGTSAAVSVAVSVDGVARETSDGVLRLYLGLLRRFPTEEELETAVGRVEAGTSLAGIAGNIMSSLEYRARRPNATSAATIDGLYEDLLGRAPDPTGRANWSRALAEGRSPAAVAADISRSPEAALRTLTASAATAEATTFTSPTSPTSPTPAEPAPEAAAGVLAIGDSIMLSASSSIRAAVPGISVDARQNRQFTEGVAIVRGLAAAGGIPSTVLVHLGTNGLVTPDRCDELLGMLPGRRVLLVNVEVPRSWETDTNEALADCARRHGAELVDWRAVADERALASDGYHLSSDGHELFAATLAAALDHTA